MYIGVDIGGTKTLVAVGDENYQMIRSRTISTALDSNQDLIEIEHLVRELAPQGIKAIAISAPGALDRKNLTLLRQPNLPWQNIPIGDYFKKAFNVPIVLEHDANCAALAETRLGAGQGYKTVLYVTISTGIGTGITLDGQLYHGASHSEGGHITLQPDGPICGCGGRGHFESIVSGSAIKQRFGKPAYAIVDKKTWSQIAKDMATGLGSLITTLAPDIVVIGGGVGVHFGRFITPLTHYLKNASLLVPVPPLVQAKYVETASIYGCFILAKEAGSKQF